ISGPNTLVLHFPPAYNQQREHCQEPARLARIEDVLRQIAGQSWSIRVESGNGASPPPSSPTSGTENAPSRSRRQRHDAEQEPLLKRAIDVLGAQIVRVDEGFGAALPALAEANQPPDAEEL